jgi:hypothetical protein
MQWARGKGQLAMGKGQLREALDVLEIDFAESYKIGKYI